MSEPTAEQMIVARDAARIVGSMPYITAEVEHMDRQLEMQMFKAIDDGTMTPELALQGWVTKRANKRLLKNLQTRATLGIEVTQTIKESV